MKVVIIDYGMGNIKSLRSALNYIGVSDIVVSNNMTEIVSADRLILPGVGAFPEAMTNMKKSNLISSLKEVVLDNKKPILGICLGMQLMTKSSTEGTETGGLDFINGKVERLIGDELKIPHVGFNQVEFVAESKLYRGLNNQSDFYFTHSYGMNSNAKINQAFCQYGQEFIASYELDHIAGVQFHPELSQTNGLKLLENFIEHF